MGAWHPGLYFDNVSGFHPHPPTLCPRLCSDCHCFSPDLPACPPCHHLLLMVPSPHGPQLTPACPCRPLFYNPSRSFLVLQNEIQTLSLAREAPRDLTGSLVPGPRVLCVPQDLTTHARNAHSPGLSAWGRCHSSFQSQPSRLSGKPPGPLSSSGLPCHFRSGSHPDPGPQTRPRDAPAPCNMSAVRTGACRVHLCAPAAQLKV